MKAPKNIDIEYPSLLGQPAPQLRAYPPETVTAEKFQAMVALGEFNSRMKDFFDLWAIAGAFTFDGAVLAQAILKTFECRRTPVPSDIPLALTETFARMKQGQWAAFLKRTEIALAPGPFPEVQSRVADLVLPPAAAIVRRESFKAQWPPGGPWAVA